MKAATKAAVLTCAAMMMGCVSQGKHLQTVAELEGARKDLAETSSAFATFKKQSSAQMEALQQEKNAASNELLTVQAALSKAQQTLETTQKTLDSEREGRRQIETQLGKLRDEHEKIIQISGELRRERDIVQTKLDELQRQLETVQQDLANTKKALAAAQVRIAAGEKEISESRNQARDLEVRLSAEQLKVATLREDKQRLMTGTTTAKEEIARLQKRAGDLETAAARVTDLEVRLKERDQEVGNLRQELGRLLAQAHLLEERLKAEETQKTRLEQERLAKEAEIQRLTATQGELAKSLQEEIAKGDVRIRQFRDRLTINMVDRVLFESGQGQVKPAGLKVLKQLSEVLKTVTDKQIRIEGHTDNVPIGVKLRERFPTNWELSTARATSVVRYLIEEGGVDRTSLSAVGYADTRPIASNDTEEGRTANRRIEIVLYPKDLSDIMSQIKP